MPHQTNITHLLFKSTQSTCHNPLYVHKWHKSTHSSQPLSLQNYHFDCSPHGKAALPFPHRAWQPTIRKFIFIIILECDTRFNTGSLPTSESDHTTDRRPGQDHHFLFPPNLNHGRRKPFSYRKSTGKYLHMSVANRVSTIQRDSPLH